MRKLSLWLLLCLAVCNSWAQDYSNAAAQAARLQALTKNYPQLV